MRTFFAIIACVVLVIIWSFFCASMGWRFQGGAIPAGIFYTGLIFVWQAIRGTGLFKKKSAIQPDDGSGRFSGKSDLDAPESETTTPDGCTLPSIPLTPPTLPIKYGPPSIPLIPAAAPAELYGYELLAAEKEKGYRHEALWLKCHSEVDGDQTKAGSAYNRARAQILGDEFSAKKKADEDFSLAMLKATEAEKKHLLDEINAILLFPSEFGFDFPGRSRLEKTLAKFNEAVPRLVIMGEIELIKKVEKSHTYINELIVTHEEHRAALEMMMPLIQAKKTAIVRSMYNKLEKRFDDLDYTPVFKFLLKRNDGFLLFFIIGVLVLAALIILLSA